MMYMKSPINLSNHNKKGILLINLGTPDSPSVLSVGRYLRTFLMDKRVIELPYIFRWALVHGLIIPFRTPSSAKLYKKIWCSKGSPLLINSQEFAESLNSYLGDEYEVSLGMRYGEPSISNACRALLNKECNEIVVVPLFPQYSSAATGSALEEVYRFFAKEEEIPQVTLINEFYQARFYIRSLAKHIYHYIQSLEFDCLLMSYHGLPKKFQTYRQQCALTSKLIAQTLGLSEKQYAYSFQSRLGRLEWLKPYTDEILKDLRDKGVKNLVVACPSFVADCLETLEEINIGIREEWMALGGENFYYIPCMNSNPDWIKAFANFVN